MRLTELVDLVELRQELIERDRLQGGCEFLLAADIDHDDAERDERDEERDITPVGDLVEGRDQEHEVDDHDADCEDHLDDLAAEQQDQGDEDPGDRHVPGNRKTVRKGEVVRGPEDDDDEQAPQRAAASSSYRYRSGSGAGVRYTRYAGAG